jgi:hypothetical protein
LEWVFHTMGFLFLASAVLAFVLVILSRKGSSVNSMS